MKHALLFPVLALITPLACAADITVTTLDDSLADDGVCSLREAMNNARNNNAVHPDCVAGGLVGMDSIGFSGDLFEGEVATIHLDTAAGPLIAGGGALRIAPPDNHRVRLVSDGTSRLMLVQMENRPLQISRLDMENGFTENDGGAMLIQSGATVTLNDCGFDHNTALGSGGAIGFDTAGQVTLRSYGSRFHGNTAGADGGAIGTVMESRIDLDIRDSLFSSNISEDRGGAIAMVTAVAPLSVHHSHEIRSSVFEYNAGFWGGAVHVASGQNTSNSFELLVEDSRFHSNVSNATDIFGRGGAISAIGAWRHHNATVTLRRNSFHANSDSGIAMGYKAGAVFIEYAHAYVENNLFSRNWAGHGAGALAIVAPSDFENEPDSPRIVRVVFNSFYENNLGMGGGLGRAWDMLIRYSDAQPMDAVVAGNLFQSSPAMDYEAQWACVVETQTGTPAGLSLARYNVSNREECAVGNGSLAMDPGVELVSEANGSHQLALRPAPDSPALDLVPVDACMDALGTLLQDDMTGAPRPADGNGDGFADCDAGAFEQQPVSDTIFHDGFE